jgi:PHB de-polymerase C-terminus
MQTLDTVFFRHLLPKGEMKHRGQLVDLKAIRHCGLMTVEGEKDDICGVGQTFAAQELCVNIPEAKRLHHLQKEVGHYGIFNGSRFRNEIAPKMRKFWADIDAMNAKRDAKSVATHATVAASGRTDDVARPPAFPPTDENQLIYVIPSAKRKPSRAARVRHPPEDPACDGPGALSA